MELLISAVLKILVSSYHSSVPEMLLLFVRIRKPRNSKFLACPVKY